MSRDVDIGASVEGDCEYKGFILDNGMKVIIITSKGFTSCGATLSINIGHNNVPHKIFGLLHLMEHVIICNLRRQDEQNKFGAILDQHGGHLNATTYDLLTTYSYRTRFIAPSLELFVQGIFEPVFDEESIASEIENVDSEYIIYSTDDTKCLAEFVTAKWNPDELDKYYGFGGNKNTLQTRLQHGINLKKELEQFHEQYFSTSLMSLIVFAKADMDTLKNLVIQILAPKIEKNVDSLPVISPHALIKNYHTKWSIVPTQHDKLLKILFPMPMAYSDFGFMPLHYIGILFRHQENGSLLSSLKEWGWCTTIRFQNLHMDKKTFFFILTFNLTQQGLNHIDDIIYYIFQYVHILQSFVMRHRLKDEFSEIMLQSYSPLSAAELQNKIEMIPSLTFLSEFKHILKKVFYIKLPIEFREATTRIFDLPFKLHRIIVCVMSKKEETNATTPSQVKFKVDKLPIPRILEMLQKSHNKFVHPHKTEFVKKLKGIYGSPVCDKEVSKRPQKISTINELMMYFHCVEKGPFEMYLQLSSKEAYCDAKNCNLNNMLAYVLRDSLSEKLYSASLVGMNCQIESNMFGIRVIIKYYRYKRQLVDALLKEIMSVMQENERIDDSRFEMLKEQYITYLKNLTSATPAALAFYYLEILIAKRMFTYEELLNEIADLSSDELKQFKNKFYNTKLMKCLIRGDMTLSEAYYVRNYLEIDCRNSTEFDYHEPELATDIKLEIGSHHLYTTNTAFHRSSCTMVYYQLGDNFTDMNDFIKRMQTLLVINAMIKEHCFDELRRKAHLGYITQSIVTPIINTCGLAIYVVGHNYETEYVEEQIDDVVQKMLHKICYTCTDALANYITKSQNQGDYNMPSLVSRYLTIDTSWKEILLDYGHDEENVSFITVQQYGEIFKEMIDPVLQRKLSLHIKSEINKPAERQQKYTTSIPSTSEGPVAKRMRKNEPTIIENIADFKSKH